MSHDSAIWLKNQFYNRIVGSVLPVSWVAPVAPRPSALSVCSKPVKLQIVSHCWNYAHLSLFQLSSLVNFPPQTCCVTYTLFHAKEDTKLLELIRHFDAISVPNVTWDWQPLSKPELFRRAIGRNRASLASHADWIWFADCDLIFHQTCLDSVARAVQGKRTGLVFPDHEGITDLLNADHPMLNQSIGEAGTIDVDTALFQHNPIHKAKGAFQIVHGDVARSVGYCGSIATYQAPSEHWRKTYEDTVFRRLIQYEGEPIPVDNLFRIRHIEKGRYAKKSRLSMLRSRIRRQFD